MYKFSTTKKEISHDIKQRYHSHIFFVFNLLKAFLQIVAVWFWYNTHVSEKSNRFLHEWRSKIGLSFKSLRNSNLFMSGAQRNELKDQEFLKRVKDSPILDLERV